MLEIRIIVRERIAELVGKPEIVCGNSEYTAVFDLDEEWAAYPVKTMRLAWVDPQRTNNMLYTDVLFEGNRAVLPPLWGVSLVWLGIYAGDIHTSTPVRIPCCYAGTVDAAQHPMPESNVYTQILDYVKQLKAERITAGAELIQSSGTAGLCGVPGNEEAI